MDIFIAENLEIVRESLQSVLSDILGIKVVGHAVNESGAIKGIDLLLPDVVILDILLQSGTGIGVLENVKKHHAEIKVIVFTNHTEEFFIGRCARAKADYFFDKSSQLMQLREVLQQWAHRLPG